MALTNPQADALAAELDVDLDRVCHACLSFVSFALEDGTPHQVAGALRRMTPDLWADGLDEQALGAARRACRAGVPHAGEALADLEERGARSNVARAIVRRLAAELSERTRRAMEAAMN
jgi:hypothetical protein